MAWFLSRKVLDQDLMASIWEKAILILAENLIQVVVILLQL